MAASDSASPDRARLRPLSRSQFDPLFRRATVVPGRFLLLRVARSSDGTTRWGFAVSRRSFGSAVDRNRIRRRLRAAASHLQPSRPLHLAVVARKNALRTSYRALEEDLERLFALAERLIND
ncbi:MAG: ribonuclease P protein component [Dehalococcoidia bacterium]